MERIRYAFTLCTRLQQSFATAIASIAPATDRNTPQTMRPSGLKPPSRIPASLSAGLHEMSASDNNARAMLPPPPQSLKHKGSARMLSHHGHDQTATNPVPVPEPFSDDVTVPEPAPKRKTLAERAGEPRRANGMPRPVNGAVRRNMSTNNLAAPRTTTSTTRPPPPSSFGSRPVTVAANYRPASALAVSRSKSALSSFRPRNAPMDEEEEEDSDGEPSFSTSSSSKRKGMKSLRRLFAERSLENINITPRRQRKPTQNPAQHVASAVRSKALSRFRPEQPLSPLRNMSLSTAFKTLSLTSNNTQAEEDAAFLLSQEEPQCPKTPSYLPKPVPKTPQPAAGLQVAVIDNSFTKYSVTQSTPGKITYLTRDSNTLAPAWDTKGRLEDMEVLYSQLKSQLDSASKENHGMGDTIDIYKTRSMP